MILDFFLTLVLVLALVRRRSPNALINPTCTATGRHSFVSTGNGSFLGEFAFYRFDLAGHDLLWLLPSRRNSRKFACDSGWTNQTNIRPTFLQTRNSNYPINLELHDRPYLGSGVIQQQGFSFLGDSLGGKRLNYQVKPTHKEEALPSRCETTPFYSRERETPLLPYISARSRPSDKRVVAQFSPANLALARIRSPLDGHYGTNDAPTQDPVRFVWSLIMHLFFLCLGPIPTTLLEGFPSFTAFPFDSFP